MKILVITADEILDSRGTPTLRVEVLLEDGSKGVFEVPSGASTGIHEAHELRDGEKEFFGKGVKNAKNNVFIMARLLEGQEFTQKELDDKLIELDGNENKKNMGANALLGISIAFAKAKAQEYQLPLYEYLYRIYNNKKLTLKKNKTVEDIHLFANVINGGLHAGNDLMVQEFMIIPDLPTIQAIQAIAETYHKLKELISDKYGSDSTAVGDEGGFAPQISTPEEALDLLQEAVKQTGYKENMYFAVDVAASDCYDENTQMYEVIKGKKMDYKEVTSYFNSLIEKYPLISIEDPFQEDDTQGFAYFMKNRKNLKYTNPLTGKKSCLVVGDDLLVTNPKRISNSTNLCDSLLLKINQIGTLSEALEAHRLSQNNKWDTIVSHRSGETIDSFIADLAVALSSSIKLGSPARGERVAKYNRLLKLFDK